MRYEIKGEPLPVVICYLEDGEQMVTEGGAMSWMSPNMKMETEGGSVGKVFGRMFSGENLFQNRYTAMGQGVIAFASSFRDMPVPSDLAAIGEIGLTGELRAVSALGQRLSEVRRLGFTKCLIPKRVQGKLSVPEGLDVIRVANIREALAAIL